MKYNYSITLTLLIVYITHVSSKVAFPKKSISLFKPTRSSISTIQLIEEPYLVAEPLTFEQERLQFDQNLVLQQELIEEVTQEFSTISEKVTETAPIKRIELREMAIHAQMYLKRIPQHCYIVGLVILSVFSCAVKVIIKNKKPNMPVVLNPYSDEEQILTQSMYDDNPYSIMNSKTISSVDEHTNKNTIDKYKLTEYPTQIRNPYDESFVKASLKGTMTTKGSNCDSSLLEIDELLQEMLRQ